MKHGKILYGRYFADAYDGTDEVELINATTDKEAIELFKEIKRG